MNKEEYLSEKQQDLIKIISENEKLDNFNRQLFAEKIGAEFKKNYEENYLWRYALYLSSTGAFLLEAYPENKVGLESCRISAEIYENLYHVSEEYDQKYSLILSSLCYDISGYQANAQCLINDLTEGNEYYQLKSVSEDDYLLIYENYIIKSVQLFLQKRILTLLNEINSWNMENLTYLSSNYKSSLKYYRKFIQKLCIFILYNENGDFFNDLQKSHIFMIKSGNINLSHILSLLQTRMKLFSYRNTWNVIDHQKKLPNHIWELYLKLLSTDLYQSDKIKPINKRNSIFEFWKSQLNAINKGVLSNNDNYVIQMPTSAGKTLIAELMIIDSLIQNSGSRCIYIAPFRALTSEIEENLGARLGKLGFNVSSATGSYELDEFQELWINDVDVLVATPEKIDLMYRLHKNYFENVSIVIIDEGHVIGDRSKRSSLLEFLIIKLRRNLENKARFVFISAVMSKKNAQECSEWLSGNKNNLISSPQINGKEWEPTRKLIGIYRWYKSKNAGEIIFPHKGISGIQNAFLPNIIETRKYEYINPSTHRRKTRKFPKKDKKETAVELAYNFINEGPVLIFTSQPRWAESLGKSFLELLHLKTMTNEEIDHLFDYKNELESIYLAKEWLGNNHVLTKCLQRGIGIHHSLLPDPVKKAIEKDFRKKNISILISTNTIGQGVNFPIKTIIIHSLSIDQRHNIKIRDFWNVVGRAGRAGKETEGQIIFLTFNDNDVHLYRRYTNKSNIESSYSLLFLILSLIQNRISGDNHDNLEILLENLIEPNLLDLLLEESVDTSDEELIREILGYSLFMIQSMDADYDIEPIVQGISKIKQKFCSIDKELRKVYSKTGLPISSCNKIYEYIQNNIAELREITIKDDYQSLFEQIINILLEIPEMNETRAKINKEVLTKNHKELTSFVIHWMDGSNINELKELWANYFTDNPLENAMYDYINKLLEYRYPWGVTIFLLILVFILNKNYSDAPIKYDDLPGNIKNLSSYIKYGLNTPSACAAKSLGVNTRETSLKISDYVGNVQLKEFINILKNLDSEDIEILNLSNFESENILYLIQKLNFGKITFEELKSLEFEVKGINYSDERIQLASKIEIGDILELKRDPNNIYDVYAVKIVYEDMELGFIPRNISKILAVEMDLNKRSFQALIINKEDEYRLKFGIID